MNSFVLQPSSTWRKLGFALYSDSLRYRDTLELNPKWNVMELPPVGAVLLRNGPTTPAAGLTQSRSLIPRNKPLETSEFFPFSSQEEYSNSLKAYPPSALVQIDRINGWSTDSPELRG
jgi:hypothetical protein